MIPPQPDIGTLRREAEARCVVLANMLKSEGWKLFEQMLKDTGRAAYQAAMNATDGLTMAKHLGALKAVDDLLSWSEREIRLQTDFLRLPAK